MRQILVPTDFSNVSKNALQYGLDLYKGTDTSFEIIHVYNPSFDPVLPEFVDSSAGMVEVVKENMNALMAGIERNNGLEITNSLELGFTQETLLEKSYDYDLIIMGTTGTNSLLDKLFGSVSSDIAANAKCPVLLIPPDVHYKGISDMIFYCDDICENTIDKIVTFADRYDSNLHVIAKNQETKISGFVDSESLKVFLYEQKDNSVISEINDFIESKKASLLIMSTRKRSFWKKILNRTKTRAFALNSKIPLLVYHHNDIR